MKKHLLLSCILTIYTLHLYSQESTFLQKLSLEIGYRSYLSATKTQAFGQYALNHDRSNDFSVGLSYKAYQLKNTEAYIGLNFFRAPLFTASTTVSEKTGNDTLAQAKSYGYALDPAFAMEIPIGINHSEYLTENSGINIMVEYRYGFAFISDHTNTFIEEREINASKSLEINCTETNRFNHSAAIGAGVFFNTKKLNIQCNLKYNYYFSRPMHCYYTHKNAQNIVIGNGKFNPNWNNIALSLKFALR